MAVSTLTEFFDDLDEAEREAERRFEAQVEAGTPGDWHANLRLIFKIESARRRRSVSRYIEFTDNGILQTTSPNP
jgi:hypothetical protein